MYTALYRAQRPEVFEEILGQEHIVKILRNQLASGSVSHAYLFCGTRGTGKTTTARILAKGVNCLSEGEKPCGTCAHCRAIKEGSFMDVIEIDAASNNGVENIRELRESVKYPPAMGRKKVYIIDEVHMLSTGAFNALLKTLEEPPEHVMFILATTEPQKLPPTILSRCMRLDFRRVSQKVIAENMRKLCDERGVKLTEDAARLLANCADGSVRDGLSILDQVMAGGDTEIDREKVLEYVGTTGEDFFIDLTELVSLKKSAEALVLLNNVLEEGKDVRQIMKDWVGHYRGLLISKFVKDAQDMLNMSDENINRLREQSRQISLEEIDYAVVKLSKTINDARWSTNPRVLLELAIVAIAGGAEREGAYAPVRPRQNPAAFEKRDAFSSEKQNTSDLERKSAAEQKTGRAEAEESSERSREIPDKGEYEGFQHEKAENVFSADTEVRTKINNEDKDMLWHRIFEEGEGSAGSFNLIRSGTTLESITDDSFVVEACSSFTKRYVEQKRQQLEALMEEHTGKKLHLKCKLKEEKKEDFKEEKTVKELAEEASNILGIDIDIE